MKAFMADRYVLQLFFFFYVSSLELLALQTTRAPSNPPPWSFTSAAAEESVPGRVMSSHSTELDRHLQDRTYRLSGHYFGIVLIMFHRHPVWGPVDSLHENICAWFPIQPGSLQFSDINGIRQTYLWIQRIKFCLLLILAVAETQWLPGHEVGFLWVPPSLSLMSW